MSTIICRRGFSLLELLLTLLFIGILAAGLLKIQKKTLGEAPAAVKGGFDRFRADFEPAHDWTWTTVNSTEITTSSGLRWSLEGALPNLHLVREGSGSREDLLEKVVFGRFTAYDSDGHFLPDVVPSEKFSQIKEVRLEVRWHDGKEDLNNFANDKINGIDLDGDPTNGTARLKERSVRVSLSN